MSHCMSNTGKQPSRRWHQCVCHSRSRSHGNERKHVGARSPPKPTPLEKNGQPPRDHRRRQSIAPFPRRAGEVCGSDKREYIRHTQEHDQEEAQDDPNACQNPRARIRSSSSETTLFERIRKSGKPCRVLKQPPVHRQMY